MVEANIQPKNDFRLENCGIHWKKTNRTQKLFKCGAFWRSNLLHKNGFQAVCIIVRNSTHESNEH